MDFNIKISNEDDPKQKVNMNVPLNNKDKSSSENPEKQKNEQDTTASQSQRNSTYDLSKASHPIICFLVATIKIVGILW